MFLLLVLTSMSTIRIDVRLVKDVFLSEAWKWEKSFHFLFGQFHFLFSKLYLSPLVWETFCKTSFFIRGMEVGEIIPFPVWTIPFPVLKIDFEFFGTYKKHFGKEFFFIRGPEVGETISFPVCIIPFPVWTIPFPVLKINLEPLGTNENHFVVEVFWSEAKQI